MSAVQLELSGEVEALERQAVDAERRRINDALACLRDSCPDTLQVVWHLDWWKDRDAKGPGYTSPWAYLVCRRGVFYEHETTWGGWDSRPTNLVSWDELRALLGDDPRRAGVVAWAESLWRPTIEDVSTSPWPDQPSWRYLTRPHELWPHPETWHPSYIEEDHAMPGHDARMAAWRTTFAILNAHQAGDPS